MMDSPENIGENGQKDQENKWSSLGEIDTEQEDGMKEAVEYFSNNPKELDRLAQELVAARKDMKEDATWDNEKRAYIGKDGLPRDWAHLISHLKENPDSIKTAIESYQELQSKEDDPQNPDDEKPLSRVRQEYNMRLEWGRNAKKIMAENPRGDDEKLEDYNKRIRELIPTINAFRETYFANKGDNQEPTKPAEAPDAPKPTEQGAGAGQEAKPAANPETGTEKTDAEKKILAIAALKSEAKYLSQLGIKRFSELAGKSLDELKDLQANVAKLKETEKNNKPKPEAKPNNTDADAEKAKEEQEKKRAIITELRGKAIYLAQLGIKKFSELDSKSLDELDGLRANISNLEKAKEEESKEDEEKKLAAQRKAGAKANEVAGATGGDASAQENIEDNSIEGLNGQLDAKKEQIRELHQQLGNTKGFFRRRRVAQEIAMREEEQKQIEAKLETAIANGPAKPEPTNPSFRPYNYDQPKNAA